MINETARFREKELNDYLDTQKRLLKAEHKLKGEKKFIDKSLKATRRELQRNNDWLRKR